MLIENHSLFPEQVEGPLYTIIHLHALWCSGVEGENAEQLLWYCKCTIQNCTCGARSLQLEGASCRGMFSHPSMTRHSDLGREAGGTAPGVSCVNFDPNQVVQSCKSNELTISTNDPLPPPTTDIGNSKFTPFILGP